MATHFLKTVRAQQPGLYKCFIALLIIISGVTIIRIEAPPFYVWSMYAQALPTQDTFEVYTFSYDGKVYNEPQWYNHHRRIAFNYSISFYDACLQAGNVAADGVKLHQRIAPYGAFADAYIRKVYCTPAAILAYPQWIKRYMSSMLDEEMQVMKVYKYRVTYTATGKLHIISQEEICKV